MKWGVAFSPLGARALAENGSLDVVVARGPAVLGGQHRLRLAQQPRDPAPHGHARFGRVQQPQDRAGDCTMPKTA